jgi:segregation and condensation protein B
VIDEVEPGADRSTDGSAPAEGSSAPEFDVDAGPVQERLTEAQLEALLFVAERPLTRREIAAVAGVDRVTIDARLGDLEIALADRGIRLILSGDRVELVTAPDAGALIARYVGADAVRLSPASMETLAIVAYRQPVTKAAVERIRGVDSDYTIRTLLHRRLIVELGRSEAPGRPFLYGTGFDFLERFGLTSLEELPPLDVELAARLVDEEAAGDADATSGGDGANGTNGANGPNGANGATGTEHANGLGGAPGAEPEPDGP